MIIDAHMHAFPNLGRPYGSRSMEEQNMYLQRFVAASPAAAVKRLRDGKVETDKSKYILWDDNDPTPNGAYDVKFGAGSFGRLQWEKDGEGYYISLYAPNMQSLESSPEFLLAHMDAVGVSMGILQNAFLYGDLNDFFSDIVKKYPDRFIGTIQVNESRADSPEEIKKLRKGVIEQGLKALYYANERFFETGFSINFDDERFNGFWSEVRDLGLPVFWDITAIYEKGEYISSAYERFMKQMLRLEGWHKRFPEIPCILVHGIPLRNIRDKDSFIPIREDLWNIWKRPNMHLELLFPMQVSHPVPGGTAWDYPYLEIHPLVRDLMSHLGPEKLIWGTDLPNTERNCTYAQARNYIDKHCPILSTEDKKLVFGENIRRIFRLD